MRGWISSLRAAAAAATVLGSGCVTTMQDEADVQQARYREDIRALQEQIQRLAGRIEGLDMEIQRLATDVEAVRRTASTAGESQTRALQGQIQDITARMNRLDAARESDRKAIVDDLSKRMAELLKRAAPAPAPARAAARQTGSATGVEHTVQAGESLSTIAVAYGVTISAIARENNISDASMIRVGQKLFIPDR